MPIQWFWTIHKLNWSFWNQNPSTYDIVFNWDCPWASHWGLAVVYIIAQKNRNTDLESIFVNHGLIGLIRTHLYTPTNLSSIYIFSCLLILALSPHWPSGKITAEPFRQRRRHLDQFLHQQQQRKIWLNYEFNWIYMLK